MGEHDLDFWQKLQRIRFDMSKASLEDVTDILNHYNKGPFVVDGVTYVYSITPQEAACLNARYSELTGQNHPVFIQEQEKVLDKMLKSDQPIIINGQPSVYQLLKNNLTGEAPGISVIPGMKGSYLEKYEAIKYDISKASLEYVKDILDHYDKESVLVSGMQYHFRPNVLEGASLNARYRELTGQDHPIFARVQPKLLDEKIKEPGNISVNGTPSIYKLLRDNAIEIGNHNHVLKRFHIILAGIDSASLEDVTALLNYFAGNPVLIDGLAHYPFNDPVTGDKINTRYVELTGKNHPVFAARAPQIIAGLQKDKNTLLQSKAYGPEYFSKLDEIMSRLDTQKEKNTDDSPELEME